MTDFVSLLAYLLTSGGMTVLIVWPEDGPSAWVRERMIRRFLPQSWGKVLDCYICTGFWVGLFFSPIWWWFSRCGWCWAGCMMIAFLFWIVIHDERSRSE